MKLSAAKPAAINYLMGVVAIPRDFDAVKAVRVEPDGLTLFARGGAVVKTSVVVRFLYQNTHG